MKHTIKIIISHASKLWKLIKVLAPIGFILSITFFVISTFNAKHSSERVVNNLMKIEQSLSTKHIGIFPNYLPQINDLLENAASQDTIIIFEDVLHYGVFSSPAEFKIMIYNLLKLSKTNNITIVYYDIDEGNNRTFRRSVQESRIKVQYLGRLANERIEIMQELRQNRDANNPERNDFQVADSIVCEKYFAYSREDADFEGKVKRYLNPLYDSKKDKDSLFYRIDEIKRKNIEKPINSITFGDFYNMYREIDEELIELFKIHGIELIGVNEFHVMSCWKTGNKAILAFPSKYATSEIGFITQDPVFSDYIHTMLKGVKEQIQ